MVLRFAYAFLRSPQWLNCNFPQLVRPASSRSIIPWSDCSAPGLSTLDSTSACYEFALLSTVLLNISSRTCNRPHPQSPKRTVIRPELSAGTCQPFCCQRTCIPDPIRGPDQVGTPSFRRADYEVSLAYNRQKAPIKYETRRRAPGTAA